MKYLTIVLVLLAGCKASDDLKELRARRYREDAHASDLCMKAGGIVVRSGWDSRIVGCEKVVAK